MQHSSQVLFRCSRHLCRCIGALVGETQWLLTTRRLCVFPRKGRYEVDGYVYSKDEEPKIMVTGKWNSSMRYQPCDVEGEPLPGTDLKEVSFLLSPSLHYFRCLCLVVLVPIQNSSWLQRTWTAFSLSPGSGPIPAASLHIFVSSLKCMKISSSQFL